MGILDVFGAGVDAQLVEGDIVVCERALKVPHFLIKFVPSCLQLVIQGLLLIDVLCPLPEVLGFLLDALQLHRKVQ